MTNPDIIYSHDFTRRDFLRNLGVFSLACLLDNFIPPEMNLRTIHNVPPSLMLHSANEQLLKELVPLLAEQKYRTLTYNDYYYRLRWGILPPKPILISIDDLGSAWLNPAYKRMINTLNEFNMTGTVGIVTRGNREVAKPEIWEFLKKIAKSGWELAIHTEDHAGLGSLSEAAILKQVGECHDEISQATGYKPKTLILPYGSWTQPDTDIPNESIIEVTRDLNISWIVGIKGGKEFSGKPPYYVGRIPPSVDSQMTIVSLEKSFKTNNKHDESSISDIQL